MNDPISPLLLHIIQPTVDVTVLFIFLSGIASAVLVSIGAVAFARRRSRSFLMVALALGTLAAKAFTGGVTIMLSLPMGLHHTIEHGLDFVTAAFLLSAIYFARTTPTQDPDRGTESTNPDQAGLLSTEVESDD